VLEGIRITRKGFPNRVAYAEFLQRYYLLVPNLARTSADPRQSVETLINQLHIDKEKYQFGLSKIFFRTGAVCANDQRVLSLSLSRSLALFTRAL
jgi:myosin heavy chain 9/10/11/14